MACETEEDWEGEIDIVSQIGQRNYEHVNFDAFRISYADLLSPVSERNAHLRACYYFECTCNRCEQEREQEDTAGAAAGGDEEAEKTDENDVHSLYKQLNEAEEKNKSNQLSDAVRLCEQLLKPFEPYRGETPHSPHDAMYVLQAKFLDLYFDLLIKTEQFDKAQQFGIDLLACLRRLLPHNYANLGIHLAKLAKLSAYLGHLESALQFYEAALCNLDVSHGESHPYVEHVRGQLYVPLLQELKRQDVRSSL